MLFRSEWWLKDGVTSSSELADKVIAQQEEIEKWRDALDVDDYKQSVINDDKGVEMGEMDDKETVEIKAQEGAQEKDKRLLNEKAERFANAIVEKSKDEKGNAKILEHLWFELDRCIKQGADFGRIDAIVGHLGM